MIHVMTDRAVRLISIDRPSARNALSPEMLGQLTQAVHTASAEDDLHAVLLRGAGTSPFSAGYDLGAIPAGDRATGADARRLQQPVRSLCDALSACRHPVIGAARRFAIGAGFDVFAHCDIRIAEEGARFALPAARLGFVYPIEGVMRLVQLMGLSRASAFLLGAQDLRAESLLRDGFLHEIHAPEAFEAEVERLLETYRGLAPLALRGIKQALHAAAKMAAPSEDTISEIYDVIAKSLNSADAKEGVAAIKEKRQAKFRGV
jgi:enoyl-CoA hydratase/carnithine racemase